ncbi:2Fe-2S iron-sulfur cluster-binding protein [Sulfitobacter sp.]|uniref:2Fe-2S iron-sulfur cluster-binding protein n=1 Tax=Sulfitobacter sp. TaxID=1903071 RepID=UPI003EF4F6F3
MFKLLEEISGASVSFVFEDVLISAPERATVAGALLCNGFSAIRRSPVSGAERGPFCMMGTCFECLVQNMAQAGVEHVSGATVWNVDEDGNITYSIDSHARKLRGKHIIIASGAIERPVPLPGWTLPGVMTAGAAQILMKSEGLVAQNAVLVGSGPLLYLVAAQLLAAGAAPKALVETQTRAGSRNALPHAWRALKDWRQLVKGLRFFGALRRAKVRRYKAATGIEIIGRTAAKAVQFHAGGKKHRIRTDLVLLPQGVVPNTQISRALALDHRFDEVQRCFHPVVDVWGQTSKSVFSIAGDGAGIGGAKAAEFSGQIAALNALVQIGLLTDEARDALAVGTLKERKAALSIRPFLDALYAPPLDFYCLRTR